LELVEKVKKAGLPNLYTGIASGKVISGKIGSYSGKLDFTVIGNPVNLASRFKTESKKGTEQTGIIISGTTVGLSKGKAKVKYLRRVAIKGKSRMYNIYELVGIRD
jgi:class 3 adenylate cyclase